uniref:Putative salivary secreted protein n=1 Tax=Ornithodoros parkeri TaxID=140564 RepID=A6N9V3_ORNPR|nr:putative salivary secreted protein [Ornithodoros parkeri]
MHVAIIVIIVILCGLEVILVAGQSCKYPNDCSNPNVEVACQYGREWTWYRDGDTCVQRQRWKCGSGCNTFNSESQCETSCKSSWWGK